MNTLNKIVEEITEYAEAQHILKCVKDIFGYEQERDGDFLEFCKKWTYDTPEDNTVKMIQTLTELISDVEDVESEMYNASDNVSNAYNSIEDIYISEDCASDVKNKMKGLLSDLKNPKTEQAREMTSLDKDELSKTMWIHKENEDESK